MKHNRLVWWLVLGLVLTASPQVFAQTQYSAAEYRWNRQGLRQGRRHHRRDV